MRCSRRRPRSRTCRWSPFTLAVSLYTLCDPSLLELPPALAIEAQLGLLRALGGLEDVSLWGRDSDGRLRCEVFVGPREPSRRAARGGGGDARGPGTGPHRGATALRRGGAAVAAPARRADRRIPRAQRERGLVLLDQAASMIGPMLERLSLLERSADRERSLLMASERRITRLGFDLHDQPLQEVAALASEMQALPRAARPRGGTRRPARDPPGPGAGTWRHGWRRSTAASGRCAIPSSRRHCSRGR